MSFYHGLFHTGNVRNMTSPNLSLMANNVLLPFEGLWAGVAGKKPLCTMDMLFMDLQVAAVSKRLHARLTAVDDICFDSMVRAGQESGNRLQQYENTKCAITIRCTGGTSVKSPAVKLNLPSVRVHNWSKPVFCIKLHTNIVNVYRENCVRGLRDDLQFLLQLPEGRKFGIMGLPATTVSYP